MTSFEAAQLYHTHHTLHAEDVSFWLKLAGAGCQAGRRVLELGCGTGRVLLPLAQAGCSVLGVDNDPAMLALLRQRWLADGAPQAAPVPRAPVVQADFLHLPLAPVFDLALLPCNTYTTLSAPQRLALLHGLRVCLRPAGRFAVAMPNPLTLLDLPRRSAPQLEETFAHPLDGEPVQVSCGWLRSPHELALTWHYDHLKPDGEVQRTTLQVRHQLDPLETYLQELAAAGFAAPTLYGDYDETPYAEDSPQVILLTQKQEI
jgi:SAM-dependent methyltransferase